MKSILLTALAGLGACASPVDLRVVEPTPAQVSQEALALEGTDHRGRNFDLQRIAAEKPTLVIFYRGHW